MTTTFEHQAVNAHQVIEEAQRVVILTTAARDDALRAAADIVTKAIKKPRTCGHPKAALSKQTALTNKALEEVKAKIEALIADGLPF